MKRSYWYPAVVMLSLCAPAMTWRLDVGSRAGFSSREGRMDCTKMRGGSDSSSEMYVATPSIQEPRTWSEPRRALVLMDVFSEYHGIYLSHQAREVYGVATLSVLSYYMKGFFEKELPPDVDNWRREYLPSESDFERWMEPLKNLELVGISCESDSGLDDAEQLASKLNITHHNGVNEARRDKFQMLETLRSTGLPVVKQRLCDSSDKALSFAQDMGLREEPNGIRVVVKPTRGVASDDVHLCETTSQVEDAFNRIKGSTIFGSPREQHESVLVQEFAVGQEFALDIVSKNGEHKVAAIWIYDKRPANGAPFVYYRTEVYDGEESQALYDYATKALDGLGIRWGLTHTEIIITNDGARLVEVNCRQHNMDFIPLTMASIGYKAFDMLLAAYLGGQPSSTYPSETARMRLDWEQLPNLQMKRMNGAMVHLSSFVHGRLKSINEVALREIQAMESVMDLEVYGYFLDIGNEIRPTVDIRTDCGWVQLVNPDEAAFRRDYERIVELMPTLFEVE